MIGLRLILAFLLSFAQGYWPTVPATASGGSNNLVFEQTCNKNQNSSATTTTIAIGCVKSIASGDYVLLSISAQGSTAGMAVTSPDPLGNTWGACTVDSGTDQAYCGTFITTGGTETLTLTWTGSTSLIVFSSEWQGANASPIDQYLGNGSIASSTSWTLPSIITTANFETVIGIGNAPSGCTSITAGTGYTIPTNGKIVTQYGFEEYQIVNSTGTYAPTATMGSACSGKGFTVSIKSS